MEIQVDAATGAALIPLNGKRFPGRYALIDVGDIALMEQGTWRAVSTNRRNNDLLYVSGYLPGRRYVYLHRHILGVSERCSV